MFVKSISCTETSTKMSVELTELSGRSLLPLHSLVQGDLCILSTCSWHQVVCNMLGKLPVAVCFLNLVTGLRPELHSFYVQVQTDSGLQMEL